MSGTVATEIGLLRRLLQDRKPSDYVIPTTRLEELMNAAIDDLTGPDGMGMGKFTTDAWLTTVIGTDVYTVALPTFGNSDVSAPSLQHLDELVGTDLNWPIQKISREEMNVRKSGPGKRSGHPVTHFCIWEDTAQALQIRLDPYPTRVDTLQGIWEPVHRRVEMLGETTVMASKRGLTAIRLRTAADAVEMLDDPALARLGITRAAAARWRAQSESLVQDEYFRLNGGQRVGHIVRAR